MEEDKGEYVMQADLNEVFVGPEFDFTVGRRASGLPWQGSLSTLPPPPPPPMS